MTYGQRQDLRLLTYLPLAPVFERAFVECATLVAGNSPVFFAESIDTFLADLQRARPTGFISVPRLWLRFQQGVVAKMPPKKLDPPPRGLSADSPVRAGQTLRRRANPAV